MAQNKLKYTGLTYDDIQSQVTDLIYAKNDTRFDRFRESSVAQTLIEVFTGSTDILMYYLNRRAEECYFDTAQLRSSVISLSRMFGYVVNRKEPAKAYLKLKITGNIKDNQVQIPYYSKFAYGGNNYILRNTFTYRLTQDQYNSMITQNDNFTLTVDVDSFNMPMEIVQGDIKEKVFNGKTNVQIGAPFQVYKIDDQSFSNIYGNNDYFYNGITKVWVGENKSSDTEFIIDRRSLLNWDYISNPEKDKRVCLIRTATDNTVELTFGNGNDNNTGGFSRKGALTQEDNIYVQYLSTVGAVANKFGVIGDRVNFSGKMYNSNGDNITGNISFELSSNIFGGTDDESMDSIKHSAPSIYYSLDRLVSKTDYISFLKSLHTPIVIKNAVAWGEQEERQKYNTFALHKLYNTILFTVAGSLYNLEVTPHYAKTGEQYGDAVLDLNYTPYSFLTQGYYNVFIAQDMVNQINRYKTTSTFYEIDSDNFASSDIEVSTSRSAYDASQLNVIATNIKTKINTFFKSNTNDIEITFKYTSDNKQNVSYISTYGTVTIPYADINNLYGNGDELDGELYLTQLANIIDNALSNFIDYRGNSLDNSNFGKPAFIGRYGDNNNPKLLILDDFNQYGIYNNLQYMFRLRFHENSPCYITEFSDTTLLGILNLSYNKVYPVATNNKNVEMNGKITNLIKNLNNRSQGNVKNIYVSPIIHRFNLVGTVYIKGLYDRSVVKNDICDSIYEWLDINADFNTPIYLSNIIELIEQNDAVIHANVELKPESVYRGVESNVYDPKPDTNVIYRRYTVASDKLSDMINSALNRYLNKVGKNTYKSTNIVYVDSTIPTSYPQISLNNYICERTFYCDFVDGLYKTIKALAEKQLLKMNDTDKKSYTYGDEPNYALFIGLDNSNENTYNSDVIYDVTLKSDFATIMEDIHNDLSFVIRNNMLDSSGNIDKEYDDNNNYVRGGYSLGSEIAQVNLNAYEYNGTEKYPLLKFVYK